MQVVDLETKQFSDLQGFVNELVVPDNGVARKQTRFGIETKLDSYYQAALRSHSYSQSFSIAQVSLMPGLGKRLLQELEYRIFADIQEMSTNADFLQVVIMALTQIIPGGYINKQFVLDFMAFVVSDKNRTQLTGLSDLHYSSLKTIAVSNGISGGQTISSPSAF